jgi:hypothetical protein
MPGDCHDDACGKNAEHRVYFTDPKDACDYCMHHAWHQYRRTAKAFKIVKLDADGNKIEPDDKEDDDG